jgi:hypothetical protein
MPTISFFIWLTLNNLLLDGIKLLEEVDSVAIGICPTPLIVQLLYINMILKPMISGQCVWLLYYGNMGWTNGSIIMNFFMPKQWKTGSAKRLLRSIAGYDAFTLRTETGCGQWTSISLTNHLVQTLHQKSCGQRASSL